MNALQNLVHNRKELIFCLKLIRSERFVNRRGGHGYNKANRFVFTSRICIIH